MTVINLKNVNTFNIKSIEGTCFDVFGKGTLPQAFIGIMGEAGSGKTQTVIRLIRYKFLLDKYDHNPDNIDIMYSYYIGKWVIGILQVRGDGKTVAGGEGVEHNVDVLYEISNFILKPQNWNYKFFSALGYEVGANIRVIRCKYNKIFGNPSVQALLDFTSNGVDLVKIENI